MINVPRPINSAFWSFTDTVLRIVAKPFQIVGRYLFGDTLDLARYRESFIFNQLTQRALDSEDGIAHAFAGFRWFFKKDIFVVTGPKYIEAVANYQDPQAREPFHDLADFLDNEFVINEVDKERYKQQRADLFKFLNPTVASIISQRIFRETFENWGGRASINDKVIFACARIISGAMYSVEDLPESITPLLDEAEHAVFNRNQIGEAEFQRIKHAFRALSDEITDQKEQQILTEGAPGHYPNHLKLQFNSQSGSEKSLKELNAFSALIVGGNITALLTGILTTLAQPGNGYLRRLKEELRDCRLRDKGDAKSIHAELHKYPFLHSLYLEGLRFFAPAGPMPRASSQWGEIAGVQIPPGSHIIVPTRAILHDPKYWDNPHEFNPDRGEFSEHRLNEYPFIPFSQGKRMCPASRGFVEAMFKVALIMLKDYDLRLDSNQQLEVMPTLTKEPRLQENYYATLQKTSPSLASSSSNMDSPAHDERLLTEQTLRRSRRIADRLARG